MKAALMTVAIMVSMMAHAETADVGKPFPSYTLNDQFGQTHTLSTNTRMIVIASEKEISGKVNGWLKTKDAGFLPENRIEYISDIEPMPGIITTLFALPKMKKYPFTLLLATEKEFARIYPAKKGKIALFILDDQQVLTAIHYVEKTGEIDALLVPPPVQ